MSVARFRLRYGLRVRWAETDRQGIVFNGHYLTYFDVGITEYWRAIGYPYPDALLSAGSDLFVVKATVEYHAPARYDDVIEVHVRAERIGLTSLQFALQIHRGDEHLVSGEIVYVNADPASRKPFPVPAFLIEAIERFEPAAPERVRRAPA